MFSSQNNDENENYLSGAHSKMGLGNENLIPNGGLEIIFSFSKLSVLSPLNFHNP